MKYWMCFKCREGGANSGGWSQAPPALGDRVCPMNPAHGALWGPYDKWDPRVPYARRADAQRNWKRVIAKVLKITEGSFQGSLHLSEPYYLELLDPQHRYGPEVKLLFDLWAAGSKDELFLDWLEKQDTPLVKQVIQVDPANLVRGHKATIVGNKIELPPHFPGDWAKAVESGKWAELIFVMGKDDDIYIGIKRRGRFQHSSFFGGKPVKMAGTFTVNRSWEITGITNGSGHYMPGAKELAAFLDILRNGGLDLSATELKFWSGKDWTYRGDAESWYASNHV
jgi:hypothetical protein